MSNNYTKPEGVKNLERVERRILAMLRGWDIRAIEDLFNRLLSEAKRRAKLQ